MKQEIFVKNKENKMKCYRIYKSYEFFQWMLHNLRSDEKDTWGCTENAEHVSNDDVSGRMERNRRLHLKSEGDSFSFLDK